jgi:hypothetical protein
MLTLLDVVLHEYDADLFPITTSAEVKAWNDFEALVELTEAGTPIPQDVWLQWLTSESTARKAN